DRGEDRQLRVRGVLLARDAVHGNPGRGQGGEVARVDRVAVPDPAIEPEPEAGRVLRPAVRGAHQLEPGVPDGPGVVQPRPTWSGAVGEDDGVAHAARTPPSSSPTNAATL